MALKIEIESNNGTHRLVFYEPRNMKLIVAGEWCDRLIDVTRTYARLCGNMRAMLKDGDPVLDRVKYRPGRFARNAGPKKKAK